MGLGRPAESPLFLPRDGLPHIFDEEKEEGIAMKNSFILYQDYEQHIQLLTDEQAGKLLKAIFAYNQGNPFDLDPITKMAFSFIKAGLDRDNEKYKSILNRNKNNGLKGGRPKNQDLNQQENPNNPVGFLGTQNNPDEPKKADNDTDNENDNVSENETVKKKNIKKKKDEVEKPEDVSEEAWQGWVALRQKKQATVTELVISTLRKEADLLGWTLEQAMSESCLRNWQGFKASWVRNEMARGDVFQPARPHQNTVGMGGSLNKEEIVLRLKNGAWNDAGVLGDLLHQLETLRLVATQLHEKNDLQRLINKSNLRLSELTGESPF